MTGRTREPIRVIVSGETGSAKSALCDLIEHALRAHQIPVVWLGGRQERNLREGNGRESFEEDIRTLRPTVIIKEETR